MTEITISQHAEQPTAVVRAQVRMDQLRGFFSRAFRDTMTTLQAQGRHPAGPPFGKYYGMPTDVVDVEAGFPVSEAISASGDVTPGKLPQGRVVEAIHVGPYETLQQAYADVQHYFQEAGLSPGDTMWECYLTDPTTGADASTWRTQICWPVAETGSA